MTNLMFRSETECKETQTKGHVLRLVMHHCLRSRFVTMQNVVTTQNIIKLQHFVLNVESYKNEISTQNVVNF